MSNDSTAEVGPYLGVMLRTLWQQGRDEIHSGVVGAGFDDLNAPHIELLRYPRPGGVRPSTLATEMQISRQFVNDLVRQLEQRGYVTLEPDPTDGRARVIRLTDRGHDLKDAVRDEAQMVEQRMIEKLGPQRFAELRRSLEELTEAPTRNASRSPEEA